MLLELFLRRGTGETRLARRNCGRQVSEVGDIGASRGALTDDHESFILEDAHCTTFRIAIRLT
jgi:hypothetical protein